MRTPGTIFMRGRGRRRARQAFTLLETMLAVTIVAIGVLASIEAQTYFDRSNRWSSQSTVAMYLANEVRQVLATMPRHEGNNILGSAAGSESGENLSGATFLDTADDVDDFHTVTFGQALGTAIAPGERVATAAAITATRQQIPDVRLFTNGANAAGTLSGVALQNWSQHVRVEKVSPYNISTPLTWSQGIAANGDAPLVAANDCPLRVTVRVYYRPLTGSNPELMTELSWIVMPN